MRQILKYWWHSHFTSSEDRCLEVMEQSEKKTYSLNQGGPSDVVSGQQRIPRSPSPQSTVSHSQSTLYRTGVSRNTVTVVAWQVRIRRSIVTPSVASTNLYFSGGCSELVESAILPEWLTFISSQVWFKDVLDPLKNSHHRIFQGSLHFQVSLGLIRLG